MQFAARGEARAGTRLVRGGTSCTGEMGPTQGPKPQVPQTILRNTRFDEDPESTRLQNWSGNAAHGGVSGHPHAISRCGVHLLRRDLYLPRIFLITIYEPINWLADKLGDISIPVSVPGKTPFRETPIGRAFFI